METTAERPDYEVAATELEAMLERLGVTITCEFVPWSRSRNAGEKQPTVNWHVTVKRASAERVAIDGGSVPLKHRVVLVCDYSQGTAHLKARSAPARKHAQRWPRLAWIAAAEAEACEKGKGFDPDGSHFFHLFEAVAPSRVDVLSSLAMDASVLDFARYEDWAAGIGYDADSRKGEACYRACLEHALALRSAIGDAELAALRELAGRL